MMEFFRHLFKEDKMIRIDDDRCVRCGICVKECRNNVLAMVNDEKGLHVGVVHPENCSHCTHCVDSCSFKAISFSGETSKGRGKELAGIR
ncbi:MAG: ferredoxin family protein [Bacteroidales bacterium]|jgi:NAD-dependent dihydropyrimidine dehydrogenase PreA subunit|nr:ferredoxin family protein [Bacteroidales bacterium]MCI1786270.1 ferredoxin family protein [Bacteroidales bacterium]